MKYKMVYYLPLNIERLISFSNKKLSLLDKNVFLVLSRVVLLLAGNKEPSKEWYPHICG